ncbi:MAG: hypothetical protein L0Y66_03775 [Myxococcaceae bacterium]|nr:hypothetical protein [Myxococcaceae bacterium]MCI0669842.1 hypothetical protein [Myxococcaceae bacterium]
MPSLRPSRSRHPWAPLTLLALALTACAPCGGTHTPTATPAATRITVLPLGEGAAAHVEAVRAGLTATYPGLPVTVAPAEPLPAGVEGDSPGAVSAEKLMDTLAARGPGLLVLLDADLGSRVFSSVFSQVDFPRGNAVVALARFHTADGSPPAPGAALSAEAQARAGMRTRKQAINAVGKLLALFPCKEERCVLQRPSGVQALDKAEGLCPRHAGLVDLKMRALREARGEATASP